MAAYIDGDYVDAFLGADVREALFTASGGTYQSAQFDQLVAAASEVIRSVAKAAGYDLEDDTTDELVKLATLVQFLTMAPPTRKGYDVATKFLEQYQGLAEAIRSGKLPLTGTPVAIRAVGGVDFTNSDRGDQTAINNGDALPQIFKKLRVLW